jgi:hypothetical protein
VAKISSPCSRRQRGTGNAQNPSRLWPRHCQTHNVKSLPIQSSSNRFLSSCNRSLPTGMDESRTSVAHEWPTALMRFDLTPTQSLRYYLTSFPVLCSTWHDPVDHLLTLPASGSSKPPWGGWNVSIAGQNLVGSSWSRRDSMELPHTAAVKASARFSVFREVPQTFEARPEPSRGLDVANPRLCRFDGSEPS